MMLVYDEEADVLHIRFFNLEGKGVNLGFDVQCASKQFSQGFLASNIVCRIDSFQNNYK
jgi:hypothetical protein